MIGRLILTYPEASRRAGGLLLLLVTTACFYGLGISSAWIGRYLPITAGFIVDNETAGRILSSVLLALAIALNWRLLHILPTKKQQTIAVWLELFILLMLFFYSFDLSFAFIAKKISWLCSLMNDNSSSLVAIAKVPLLFKIFLGSAPSVPPFSF